MSAQDSRTIDYERVAHYARHHRRSHRIPLGWQQAVGWWSMDLPRRGRLQVESCAIATSTRSRRKRSSATRTSPFVHCVDFTSCCGPRCCSRQRHSTSGLGTVNLFTYPGPATRRFGGYRGGTFTGGKVQRASGRADSSSTCPLTSRRTTPLIVDDDVRVPVHRLRGTPGTYTKDTKGKPN